MSALTFILSEHPAIVNFRWSHTQSYGSTWAFLFTAIAVYVAFSLLLRHVSVPLGPLPAVLSLALAVVSATIFAGTLISTAAEIRDTRWLWSHLRRGGRGARLTPVEWLLCFPLGTRPSGRVFFWSYLFYLSRFLHMSRALAGGRRTLTAFRLINHSILAVASFLWLEFSQSLQVPAILAATLSHAAVHGYRVWTAIGLPTGEFGLTFVVACRVGLLGCHVAFHVAALALHVVKGGCNGVGGAWVINSALNAVILFLFLNFHAEGRGIKKTSSCSNDNDRANENNNITNNKDV